MHIIGLTGGIASGKSTVSGLLKNQGAFIVDTDQIARDIVRPGMPALADIVTVFGREVLLPDGSLNRRKLGDLVFRSPELRQKLNDIMHERIKREMEDEVRRASVDGCRLVVLDVPLLIEVGWQSMADTVWVVYIPRELQLARLMARDRLTAAEAADRLRSQMSLEEKKGFADVVIDNSGSLEDTARQVRDALAKLTCGAAI